MKKSTNPQLPLETVQVSPRELKELNTFYAVKGRKIKCTREQGVARVTLFNFLLTGRVRRDILDKIRAFKTGYPVG